MIFAFYFIFLFHSRLLVDGVRFWMVGGPCGFWKIQGQGKVDCLFFVVPVQKNNSCRYGRRAAAHLRFTFTRLFAVLSALALGSRARVSVMVLMQP